MQSGKFSENEIRFWLDKVYRPFSDKELSIANQAGKKLGRNIAFLHGDEKLFKEFIHKRERYLDRKTIAKDKMANDIDELYKKGDSPFITGKLGKKFDPKKDGYRPFEQFITNLGFFHRCKSQNSIDIIQELNSRKILSPEFSAKTTDLVQFLNGLRLKEQAALGRQGAGYYLDLEAFNKDKKDLEEKIENSKKAIEYLKSLEHPNKNMKEKLASYERALFKLEADYAHLLDMAPGKILTPQDLKLLQEKYIPLGQDVLKQAIAWTKGEERLGFVAQSPAPLLPAFSQQQSVRFVRQVSSSAPRPIQPWRNRCMR
jgi:hypothetical protein